MIKIERVTEGIKLFEKAGMKIRINEQRMNE